jgi:TonB-linked SusC/RagA family outer membrane protein
MRKITPGFFKNFCVFILLLFINVVAYAQTVVSGKVMDANGVAVAGATVAVKGSTAGTSTDADGNFSLTLPANAKTLLVSGVGYTTQELAINGQSSFSVALQSAASDLNEVVVVGYGTARKKDLTGATVSIGQKDFQKGIVGTPDQLLVGKVAGVSIVSNGGNPGSGSTIRIRGGASLSASNDPLIIVDGVQLGGGGIAGSSNFLNTINPNDIESFTVLKDASAAGMYGSRATNGVIIITTKKGKSGKPKFNFGSSVSVGWVGKKLDVMSPDEFRAFVNQYGTPEQIAQMGVASTDWQDEVYQRALGTDNNLSVSGTINGKIKLPYRVSVGYFNQEGVLKTSELKRYSGAVNLNPSFLNDHLKFDISVKGTNTHTRFADEGSIGGAARFNPTVPVRTGYFKYNGFYELLDPNNATGLKALAPRNPVGALLSRHNNSEVNRSIGNIQTDYKFHFLPDLRVNLNLGYDIARGQGTTVVDSNNAGTYRRKAAIGGNPALLYGGENNKYKQEHDNTFLEAYLNYAKDIAAIKSRVDLTAGYGWYDDVYRNYGFDSYFYNGILSDTIRANQRFDRPHSRLISYYGRGNFTINEKYLFTGTFRSDASSKLNPDNRRLNYFSGAASWRISEEGFLKNSKAISDLKIRGSYGITGQQDGIGIYSYLNVYNYSDAEAMYQFGDEFFTMARPASYNPKLRWEQTATTNLGLDFGFINNRITGSVDFYLKKTKDLLNQVAQSAGISFAPQELQNVGNMENKGVEFSINSIVVKKKDLQVDFGFNATYNENRITKLTAQDDPSYEGMRYGGRSGGTGGTILINSVGHPRGSFYVYKQVYDETGKPIDNLFEDLNRDGVINESDLYRYKSVNPDVFMGFSGNVAFKKLSVGFVARAVLGNYVYNNVASGTGTLRNIFDPLGYIANGSREVLKSGFSGTGDRFYNSDYYVQNASFFRLDNINVGYNFGKVFNNKADLKFNAVMQNVFVITKYNGADPESNNGIDNNFYPRPRTLIMGINLDF